MVRIEGGSIIVPGGNWFFVRAVAMVFAVICGQNRTGAVSYTLFD